MDIEIPDRKLKKTLEDEKERKKHFGADMAKKIQLRMHALLAADSLAVFLPAYGGPERCHELKGNLAGTFSMDIKQPYRLLFKPVDPPDSALDEKQKWRAIRSVKIMGVEDTHG